MDTVSRLGLPSVLRGAAGVVAAAALLTGASGSVAAAAMTHASAAGRAAARPGLALRVTPPAGTTGAQTQVAPPTSSPAPTAATRADTAPASAPAAGSAPVAPLTGTVTPDLLVTGPGAVPLDVVRAARGVRAALPVDVGDVGVAGAQARGIGVDPSTFRAWTPQATAASDPLWRAVADGAVATSFDLGKEKQLPLGSTLALSSAATASVPVRLGALASTALPGVDLVASVDTGRALGFTPGAGVLVSAPGADLLALRDRLLRRLGDGYQVVLVHDVPVPVTKHPGAFLTDAQLATVVQAATTEVGKPYVWGATGPDSFDCSGLVGWAFQAAGVSLPRTSEQLWLAGPHIAPQDARPGDLLFWANDPAAPMDIDHVAIYLGGGRMVVAPHTGDVVKVTAVYGENFRGIVRVDPATARRVGGPQRSAATAPLAGAAKVP